MIEEGGGMWGVNICSGAGAGGEKGRHGKTLTRDIF